MTLQNRINEFYQRYVPVSDINVEISLIIALNELYFNLLGFERGRSNRDEKPICTPENTYDKKAKEGVVGVCRRQGKSINLRNGWWFLIKVKGITT